MNDNPPSTETWQKLYQAAVEFAELKPWNWMWDSELFGVENPETGQVGYCCVMGGLGEYFALAMYRGARGLAGYQAAARGQFEEDQEEFLVTQDCLQVSFEDKQNLEAEDLAVIKNFALKFKDTNVWPKFRSYEPGQYPWFLTESEAEWLACALAEASEVAKRFRENRELLRRQGDRLLVRMPRQSPGGKITWQDEWNVPLAETEDITIPIPDPKRLEKIQARNLPRSGNWEADFEYLLTPIHDRPRPYFPVMFLAVHRESGFIVNGDMEPNADPGVLQSAFLKAIEQSGMLPQYVLVKREELAKILMPVAKRLDLGLSVVKRLDEIAKVRVDMKHFLRRRHKF